MSWRRERQAAGSGETSSPLPASLAHSRRGRDPRWRAVPEDGGEAYASSSQASDHPHLWTPFLCCHFGESKGHAGHLVTALCEAGCHDETAGGGLLTPLTGPVSLARRDAPWHPLDRTVGPGPPTGVQELTEGTQAARKDEAQETCQVP